MKQIDDFKSQGFSPQQLYEIKLGLEHGIDVKKYADPKFTWLQMEQIRLGLEEGLEVSLYAQPNIPVDEMEHIREKILIEKGILDKNEQELQKKRLMNILIAVSVVLIISFSLATLYLYKDTYFLKVQKLEMELEESVTLEYGAPFYAEDYLISYTADAQLLLPDTEDVNTERLGTQQIEYQLTNGVKTISEYLTLQVVDTLPPVIQLSAAEIWDTGNLDLNIYIESVMDEVDGDLISAVSILSESTADGNTEITYSAKDRSGNVGEASLLLKTIPDCGGNAEFSIEKEACLCKAGYTGDPIKGCQAIIYPSSNSNASSLNSSEGGNGTTSNGNLGNSSSSGGEWVEYYTEESMVEINTSTEIYGVIPED